MKANDPEKYRAVIATVKVPRTALLLLVISETSGILDTLSRFDHTIMNITPCRASIFLALRFQSQFDVTLHEVRMRDARAPLGQALGRVRQWC